MPADAFINAVATAVPDYDIHDAFIDWAQARVADDRARSLFNRMAARSGISRRWSVLPTGPDGRSQYASGGFYAGASPPTSDRMRIYEVAAPALALEAIARLRVATPVNGTTHLVVASCTGFVAPGIDQIIARELGLADDVERTLIGFMGCYAAVCALRTAYHIVRSTPGARVLVVTVELSTLHMQYDTELEPLLAMLQFGDGAAAALVTADPHGFAIHSPFAAALPETGEMIQWTVGDTGFAMHLSGEVPGQFAAALATDAVRGRILGSTRVEDIDAWAVHAGGRSILDAVARAFDLPPSALQASRDVLADYGNMSSATLMFALATLLKQPERKRGLALAFGPGLAAEGFHFERAQ